MWLIDPYGKKLQGAPISEKTRAELLKYNDRPKTGLPFEYDREIRNRASWIASPSNAI